MGTRFSFEGELKTLLLNVFDSALERICSQLHMRVFFGAKMAENNYYRTSTVTYTKKK